MRYCLLILLLLIFLPVSAIELWYPCPKPMSGHLEFTVGTHFWKDHLYIRNLQLRGLFYIYPGIRLNGVLRGNDQVNQFEFTNASKPEYYPLKPGFDELNLELLTFGKNRDVSLANSIRLGIMRYLRFPWYGQTGRMDHVVGMADIRNSYTETGYRGILWQIDIAYKEFAGFHNTAYYHQEDPQPYKLLESYVYCRYEDNWFDLEARAGRLVIRDHGSDNLPDESDWGCNIMLGARYKGYGASIFWEKVAGKIYTGLSIKFASSLFSRTAGKLRLDYNRACEGFVIQYPIFYQNINLPSKVPSDKVKVGQIIAERVITFWRIGMQRNFYEHIITREGITDPSIAEVVIKTEPMLLGIESIVSPVYKFEKLSDIVKWDSQGIRPGQFTQIVVYEFYQ